MDKRVMFAVAGSGKTTYLISQLNETDKFLLVTYTNNNVHNLRMGIIKKFGYFPTNIKLLSYYSFLYGFCFKPFLNDKCGTKGINYESNTNKFIKSNKREYYIDNFNRVYSARISKLLLVTEEHKSVIDRISKYFNHLFIDEIQDFGANDFNLLKEISKANVGITYVGDFFQHTFDTSRDGNVNKTLHEEFTKYTNEFTKMGVIPDTTTLSKSFRCSPTVCKFITDILGIKIESHKEEETIVKYIDNEEEANEIISNNDIVKLFYKEHYKYDCFSRNWGDSKGEDKYFNVCVILNKTTLDKYKKGKMQELPATTKNKLYVALSRAKNNLYLIPYNLLKEK
ncbi:UvrD-helicase domain-containing protein [Myroides odoratimimus]|uniref:UvrD-helicase domain-containing protein n=1 Tax=Myroides odoratimimus TaxID=76832 RepID=UPI00257520B5|nr:UvrD-helicase domain-containing protein [Myroides odoratimimus]MDM1036239.1 UvrD-helicase domain-containing protein [Myroides odoratimimus]MDM1460461.1 UvrD-helicase domain-containing protein [Myroides odoratimimus]